ncbi:MAG: hypothetical protein ACYSUN_11880 [Planctomycetota bacterium]
MCAWDRRLPLAVLGLAIVFSGGGQALADEEHDFEVVDAAAIYYGEGSHPKTPAVIRADSVWAEIPEYKRIVEEELDEDDAAYHLLLRKATERFDKALDKAAERDGYDMIGEVGSIKAVGKKKKKIPDITKALIDLVTRD